MFTNPVAAGDSVVCSAIRGVIYAPQFPVFSKFLDPFYGVEGVLFLGVLA